MSSLKLIALASTALLLSLRVEAASFKTVYSIPSSGDGAEPGGLLLKVNGSLYGTTYGGGKSLDGTVYKIDPATGAETILHSFNGADGKSPVGYLTRVGSRLYGVTGGGGPTDGGTVFAIDPNTGSEKIVYGFSENQGVAGGPCSNLVNVDGTLFGVLSYGGAFNNGAIFSLNLSSGAETVLYSFPNLGDTTYNEVLTYAGGLIYGTTPGENTTPGTIWSLDPATGAVTTVFSTGNSEYGQILGSLTNVGGILYGTASYGGASNHGTVFSFDPGDGQVSLVYSFTGGADGANPAGPLLNKDGGLYGVVGLNGVGGPTSIFRVDVTSGRLKTVADLSSYSNGGLVYDEGAFIGTAPAPGPPKQAFVFSVNAASGTETVLHAFTGAQSAVGNSALVNVAGVLYGVAGAGGAMGTGSVFKYDPRSDTGTVLASLSNFIQDWEGFLPSQGGLRLDGGSLYGTTFGGAGGTGSVFEINPRIGSVTSLYSFNCDVYDGGFCNPNTGLAKLGNSFFGVDSYNKAGYGGIYSFNPITDSATSVYQFAGGLDGTFPLGGLLNYDGKLYGTTVQGGVNNAGTIFTIDHNGKKSAVYSFSDSFALPAAALVNLGGMLYGTTFTGGANDNGNGSLFSFDPKTGAVVAFNLPGNPVAPLLNVGGVLYGTAVVGYASENGMVFKFDPATSAVKTLHNFTGGSDGANPSAALVKAGNYLYGTTDAGGAWGLGTVFKLSP